MITTPSLRAAEILIDSSILDQAMDVIGTKYSESASTQEEISRLANSASSTYEEFKAENDNLGGVTSSECWLSTIYFDSRGKILRLWTSLLQT